MSTGSGLNLFLAVLGIVGALLAIACGVASLALVIHAIWFEPLFTKTVIELLLAIYLAILAEGRIK